MKVLVSDPRQDLILQEFVDQGKWKTALDHCDKRLKKLKKGNDYRLQLNLLLVELKLNAAQGELRKEDLAKIVSSHSSFIDYLDTCDELDFIEHIEDAFDQVGGEIWKRVAKTRSKDEDIFQAWFDVKFKRGEFRHAAEACMHWKFNFPQKAHESTMKMILCYHLSSQHENYSGRKPPEDSSQREKDARMAVLLATQALKATPAKSSKDIALKTTADLELVIDVFAHNKMYDQAIAALEDPNTGLRSSMGSWDLVRTKSSLLTITQRFKDLAKFCKELLEDALATYQSSGEPSKWGYGEASDDSELFGLAILAVAQQNDPTETLEMEKLFQKLADCQSFNARFNLVVLASRKGSEQGCLKAAESFYRHYEYKMPVDTVFPYIPDKLRNDFVTLTIERQNESSTGGVGENGNWQKTIACQVNCLRARYDLRFSETDPKKVDVESLTNLILECIWVYMTSLLAESHKKPADNSAGDLALIVAVRGLIRLSETGDKVALHQARVLLEYIVSYSKYNYEALILLIRICKLQGSITNAYNYYRRLEIKNTQQLNEAGIFFQGMSTLQPVSVPSSKFNPDESLDTIISWTAKKKVSLGNQAIACVDKGNWSEASQAIGFVARWTVSPGHVIAVAEAIRMQSRVNSDKESPALDAFDEIIADFTDTESGSLRTERITSSPDISLTHSNELQLLKRTYNPSSLRSVWTTYAMIGLQSIVRDMPSQFSAVQLHALLYDGIPAVGQLFTLPITLIKLVLPQKHGKRLANEVLEHYKVNLETGLGEIRVHALGPTEQQSGAESWRKGDALAVPVTRLYEASDALDLVQDTLAWTDRRHTLPKDLLAGATGRLSDIREAMRLWVTEETDAVRERAGDISKEIMGGRVGRAIEALAGPGLVAGSARSGCDSAAQTLAALAGVL